VHDYVTLERAEAIEQAHAEGRYDQLVLDAATWPTWRR
jgi:hypothetical protein